MGWLICPMVTPTHTCTQGFKLKFHQIKSTDVNWDFPHFLSVPKLLICSGYGGGYFTFWVKKTCLTGNSSKKKKKKTPTILVNQNFLLKCWFPQAAHELFPKSDLFISFGNFLTYKKMKNKGLILWTWNTLKGFLIVIIIIL